MKTVNPYLLFNGLCEEAFNHYKTVFGGEFSRISRFSEIPPMEGHELKAEDANRIMHVALPISEETILYGSDSNSQRGDVAFGNNVSLSVNLKSKIEAKKIFEGLSAGGKVTMPLADTFWGAYFGMCVDRYGINWMINAEQE